MPDVHNQDRCREIAISARQLRPSKRSGPPVARFRLRTRARGAEPRRSNLQRPSCPWAPRREAAAGGLASHGVPEWLREQRPGMPRHSPRFHPVWRITPKVARRGQPRWRGSTLAPAGRCHIGTGAPRRTCRRRGASALRQQRWPAPRAVPRRRRVPRMCNSMVHRRGSVASSGLQDPTAVQCRGFAQWYRRRARKPESTPRPAPSAPISRRGLRPRERPSRKRPAWQGCGTCARATGLPRRGGRATVRRLGAMRAALAATPRRGHGVKRRQRGVP
mmetsp:Transcript_111056/g.313240  ORF Transcript_111056/g.313240 Transcript_111056/m.313240 type:complete len:276 (+) Transcript_111056:282-1109(+)